VKAMKTKVRRMYDIANVLTSIGILSKENVGSTSLQNKPSFRWVYHVLPSELGNHIPPPPVAADLPSPGDLMVETAAAAAAAGAAVASAVTPQELASHEEQAQAPSVGEQVFV